MAKDNKEPLKEGHALSMEFLEYLAELSEVDGQFIGPQDLVNSDCDLPKANNESLENNGLNDGQANEPKKNVDTPKTEHNEECKSRD